MLVSSKELLDIASLSLSAAGIDSENSLAIAENIVAAEAQQRPSHGLLSCLLFHKYRGSWIQPTLKPEIMRRGSQISVVAHSNSGCLAMRNGVRKAIEALSHSDDSLLALCVSNFQATVGYAGQYGRMAAEAGYCYIGFHTCHGGLSVPGLSGDFLSTNPFVIASPNDKHHSVVYDSSCAEGSWSEQYRQNLLAGRDDDEISVSPWGGGKGVGLSIAIEWLVSTLTRTKAFGSYQEAGLGSFAVLMKLGSSASGEKALFPSAFLQALDEGQSGGVRVPGYSGPSLNNVFHEATMIDVNEQMLSLVRKTASH